GRVPVILSAYLGKADIPCLVQSVGRGWIRNCERREHRRREQLAMLSFVIVAQGIKPTITNYSPCGEIPICRNRPLRCATQPRQHHTEPSHRRYQLDVDPRSALRGDFIGSNACLAAYRAFTCLEPRTDAELILVTPCLPFASM